MSDLSPTEVTPDIRPSIPQETECARVSRRVQNRDYLSEQNDLLQGEVYQLSRMLVEAGIAAWPINLDTVLVELGPRITSERIGNFHVIKPRTNTMGS